MKLEGGREMLATMKAVMLALVVTGAAGTTVAAAGVDHVPLQKAIDIHKEHLGENSTMPEQSMKGQQNALDHLLANQEKWLARNITQHPDNDTDDPD